MSAKNDRLDRRVVRLLGVALLCGGLACATTTHSVQAAKNTAVLKDVRVEHQGEMTVVTLEGIGQPLYAASDEKDRLVVDLDGVRPEGVPDEIAVVGGVVQGVEVQAMVDATGAPFTRVAMNVDSAVQYDVVPEGHDLAIHVMPKGDLAAEDPASMAPSASGEAATEPEKAFTAPAPMASAQDADAGAQPGPDAQSTPDAQPTSDTQPAPAAVPAVQAPAATTITGVKSEGEGRILLQADGRKEGVEHFALSHPARFVLDAAGLKSSMKESRVAVNDGHVSRVRVGQHDAKVRVVLDGAKGETFDHVTLTPVNDGLEVALGAAAAEAAAAGAVADSTPPAAPAPDAQVPAAPAPDAKAQAPKRLAATKAELESASTQVSQVQYLEGAGSDKVVIVTQGKGSYQLFEPDPQTVVVSLPDSALLPDVDARIAPKPGGPVSLVMAFQQPDTKRPEVRVVITRGPGEKPMVTREGSNVVVAFDSHGSKASEPPTLSQGQGSTAAAKAMSAATAPNMPASAEDGNPLDILQEGGLLDGKQYVGRRISLDFKDVEIDDVLRLIAEVSDLNIIAGDDVSGKVTIRLVDVPWDQALDVILLTKSLGFVKVGNVLRIAPQTMLQQEAESRLQERRAKEKLEDLVVKFQPVNYAAVSNVAKMVQRLLTSRGTVNTDTRTNTVIIKDIPSVIDESVALIKAIDTPTPQVLIEAKIVEANLDFSRELGTVWGFGMQPNVNAFDSGSAVDTTRGTQNFAPHPDPRLLTGPSQLNNFVVDNPISSVPTALLNMGAFLLDQQYNVEVQLQAAESTGEGKVISSPRVVTLDNRQAQIQQGVAIPYQTFQNGDAQLQFVDAVLSLKVKPHITADKSIIMQLEVTRDAPDDSVATGSVGAPAIAKNQAKTETLVRDGQTLVIGGIYTVQKTNRESRVPFLSQIPVLGYAFRNSSVRDFRKELLIFVTPRVVQMPQIGA